jgi:hypothetical protein
MTFRYILGRVVFLVLLGYLISRVCVSFAKLREQRVGITLTHEISKTVLYPTITICQHNVWALQIDTNFTVPEEPKNVFDSVNYILYSFMKDNM